MGAEDRDGCIVRTAPLAAVVTGFIDDWKRTRPHSSNPGQKRRSGELPDTAYGAEEWLEYQTGCQGFPVSRDRIRLITRTSAPKTTELRVADALVGAIGRPELFHDGTLEVEVNPRATLSAQRECERCGGRRRQ